MTNNTTTSPDGLWEWDGANWNPTGAGATPPPARAPKKKRTGLKVAAGAFAVLVIIMAASGGGSGTTEAATPETPETETPEAPAAPEPGAPGIGDPVRDGKFEFTVTGVKTGVAQVGGEYLSSQAQGAYTLVTLTITNVGDEPQTFSSSNVKGTDSQGRELDSDTTATLYADEGNDSWISAINPGNGITATVVFDTAATESLRSVTVHDSVFSGGSEVVLG